MPHPVAPGRDRDAGRRRGVTLAAVLVLLAISALAPSVAVGHAELLSSEPPAGASLAEGPGSLVLTFTERLNPGSITIILLDEAGGEIAGLAPATDDAGTTVSAPVPQLEPGTYTVRYQVLSAVDGHTTSGSFAFLVDPTGMEAPPGAGTTSITPATDAPAVTARWLALAPALVAFGSALFWLLGGRRTLLRAGAHRTDADAPWLLIGGAAGLALVGLTAYLLLAARPLQGDGAGPGSGFPLDPAAPFGWTPFAVAMRTALVALVAAVAVAAWRIGWLRERGAAGDPPLAWVTALLLASALLGMSLAGHVAALGGLAFAALDWLHLLAAGAWLGAIPAFAAVVSRARRGGLDARPVLREALRAHGRTALVAAPIVVLTGIANSPLVTGEPREVVGSGYGNLVIGKALLFSAAIGIGALNHLLVRRVGGRLGALLVAELAVALLAVLAAATMVTIQPASSRQPAPASSAIGATHLSGTAGSTAVRVAVNLASPGEQRYQVALTELGSRRPPADVRRVTLVFHPPPETSQPSEAVELGEQAPGFYGTVGEHTPVLGAWDLEVRVERDGLAAESVTFELPVSEPMPAVLVRPPDTGIGVPGLLVTAWRLLPDGPGGWLSTVVLLGLGGALMAARARRPALRRSHVLPWVASALVVAAVAVGGVAGSRAIVGLANSVPPAAASVNNPLPATPASVERGERIFVANCSACHGTDGEGDGPTAGELPAPPRPLRTAVATATDGELAYRIGVGMVGLPMPAFDAVLSENDRWDLINYLRGRWGDDQ
jgi:copper transport protein